MTGWRTSSHSAYNGSCLEACSGADGGEAVIAVRDSKLAHSPVLVFPAAAWRAFTVTLKADD